MSDFDKEKERQKLREKYDRDREKRKETERMSQLLLQGATMTNRHCGTCGDPLFRYEGNEFCATCEGRAAEETEAAAAAEAATEAATRETPADGEVSAAAETAPETAGGDATGQSTPAVSASVEETEASTNAQQSDVGNQGTPQRHAAATTPQTEQAGETETSGDAGASVESTRQSLLRTMNHHARRAEAVEDPRRATDHLTAVREAAEALAALDRR